MRVLVVSNERIFFFFFLFCSLRLKHFTEAPLDAWKQKKKIKKNKKNKAISTKLAACLPHGLPGRLERRVDIWRPRHTFSSPPTSPYVSVVPPRTLGTLFAVTSPRREALGPPQPLVEEAPEELGFRKLRVSAFQAGQAFPTAF